MRRLVDVWISQAEARQRAGRAGRVRAGKVFKLFTKHRSMVHMAPSRTPEMLRGPLQEICLQLRLAPLLQDMPLRAAFERALTPPPEAAVATAISGLQRTAALDEHEQLTPLGHHLAALPVDIGVGRLIIYAVRHMHELPSPPISTHLHLTLDLIPSGQRLRAVQEDRVHRRHSVHVGSAPLHGL